MRLTATWQRHRGRWILLAVALLALAAVAALLIRVLILLQPQRFTGVLEQELAAAGIRLTLQAPARPALFPRPAVRLQGFSLTGTGSENPVLQAGGATIVVPWRALLRGEAAIERVEVEAPRIDLGELQALAARLPRRAGPPRLPTILTGVHLSGGTVSRGGSPLLFDVDADTGELVPGRSFRLDVAARTASGRRVHASLDTIPSEPHDGTIDFDPIRLDVDEPQGASLQVAGSGSWQGGATLALRLEGLFRHRPLLPTPAAAVGTTAARAGAAPASAASTATVADQVRLDVQPGSRGVPLTIGLRLAGDRVHADLRLQPTEIGGWWQRLLAASAGQPPGPLPFTGKAQIGELDLGWLKATDVTLDADPDLAPASGASSAGAHAAPSASGTR